MSTLTFEVLSKLSVGNQIEAKGLFPGMTGEPLVLTLIERKQTASGGCKHTFDLSFFGIYLGKRYLFVHQGKDKERKMIWAE